MGVARGPDELPQSGADARRCHACGGIMLLDEATRMGGVVIRSSYVCQSCASVSLVLSPALKGGLVGSMIFCGCAAGYFWLEGKPQGWVGAAFALGLGAFFGLLLYLRARDERRNPPL